MGYKLEKSALRKEDRYLLKRGKRWYYMGRVPGRFRAFGTRRFVRTSLKTESLEVARFRRDALEAADDDFWASMLLVEEDQAGRTDERWLRDTLSKR